MSYDAVGYVMGLKVGGPARKLVLLQLADSVSRDTWECERKQQTLADDCEMSVRALREHLKALEDAGLIEQEHQRRDDGSLRCSRYRIVRPGTPPTKSAGGTADLVGGTTESAGGAADFVTPGGITNPQVRDIPAGQTTLQNLPGGTAESAEQEPGFVVPKVKDSSSTDVDGAFDAFWRTYPRRIGKGQARKAWAGAAKKVSTSEVLAGAQRYAERVRRERTEERFVPHPATWLNGERWADEERAADSQAVQEPSRPSWEIDPATTPMRPASQSAPMWSRRTIPGGKIVDEWGRELDPDSYRPIEATT